MDAPTELIDFLKKALAKNPEARFESAVEMQAAFVELGIRNYTPLSKKQ